MTLHFLDFDYSEDEDGIATWDALASVPAQRLPGLLDEIGGLLAWAHAAFGAHLAPHEDGGLWQYDLQFEHGGHAWVELRFDPATGRVPLPLEVAPQGRVTLSLSLSGAGPAAQAFTARLGDGTL